MPQPLIIRWCCAIALLLVGSIVATHWSTPVMRTSVPYLTTVQQPHTAADLILLGQRINLNCADATALQSIVGIGPALASRIVEDRRQHGPFTAVDELQRVRGIGPVLFGRMRSFVRIGPCPNNG